MFPPRRRCMLMGRPTRPLATQGSLWRDQVTCWLSKHCNLPLRQQTIKPNTKPSWLASTSPTTLGRARLYARATRSFSSTRSEENSRLKSPYSSDTITRSAIQSPSSIRYRTHTPTRQRTSGRPVSPCIHQKAKSSPFSRSNPFEATKCGGG